MFVPNPYKNPQNIQIHEDIRSRGFRKETDIREHLRSKFSEPEIQHYLNYRYQKKEKARLSGGKIPRKTRRTFQVIAGCILLFLHFTIIQELDPIGYIPETGTLVVSPISMIMNAVLFYGGLVVGTSLLIIAGITTWQDRDRKR